MEKKSKIIVAIVTVIIVIGLAVGIPLIIEKLKKSKDKKKHGEDKRDNIDENNEHETEHEESAPALENGTYWIRNSQFGSLFALGAGLNVLSINPNRIDNWKWVINKVADKKDTYIMTQDGMNYINKGENGRVAWSEKNSKIEVTITPASDDSYHVNVDGVPFGLESNSTGDICWNTHCTDPDVENTNYNYCGQERKGRDPSEWHGDTRVEQTDDYDPNRKCPIVTLKSKHPIDFTFKKVDKNETPEALTEFFE